MSGQPQLKRKKSNFKQLPSYIHKAMNRSLSVSESSTSQQSPRDKGGNSRELEPLPDTLERITEVTETRETADTELQGKRIKLAFDQEPAIMEEIERAEEEPENFVTEEFDSDKFNSDKFQTYRGPKHDDTLVNRESSESPDNFGSSKFEYIEECDSSKFDSSKFDTYKGSNGASPRQPKQEDSVVPEPESSVASNDAPENEDGRSPNADSDTVKDLVSSSTDGSSSYLDDSSHSFDQQHENRNADEYYESQSSLLADEVVESPEDLEQGYSQGSSPRQPYRPQRRQARHLLGAKNKWLLLFAGMGIIGLIWAFAHFVTSQEDTLIPDAIATIPDPNDLPIPRYDREIQMSQKALEEPIKYRVHGWKSCKTKDSVPMFSQPQFGKSITALPVGQEFEITEIIRNVRVPSEIKDDPELRFMKQIGMDLNSYVGQQDNFWETADFGKTEKGYIPLRFGKIPLCLISHPSVAEFVYHKTQSKYLQFGNGPETQRVSMEYRFRVKRTCRTFKTEKGEEKTVDFVGIAGFHSRDYLPEEDGNYNSGKFDPLQMIKLEKVSSGNRKGDIALTIMVSKGDGLGKLDAIDAHGSVDSDPVLAISNASDMKALATLMTVCRTNGIPVMCRSCNPLVSERYFVPFFKGIGEAVAKCDICHNQRLGTRRFARQQWSKDGSDVAIAKDVKCQGGQITIPANTRGKLVNLIPAMQGCYSHCTAVINFPSIKQQFLPSSAGYRPGDVIIEGPLRECILPVKKFNGGKPNSQPQVGPNAMEAAAALAKRFGMYQQKATPEKAESPDMSGSLPKGYEIGDFLSDSDGSTVFLKIVGAGPETDTATVMGANKGETLAGSLSAQILKSLSKYAKGCKVQVTTDDNKLEGTLEDLKLLQKGLIGIVKMGNKSLTVPFELGKTITLL